MSTKEQKIQTAFILSIIGSAISDTILLAFIGYYRLISIFTNVFAAFVLLPTFVAPLILGCIALTILKDASGATGKYRFFYIFARVLSIISIVEGAILGTIAICLETVMVIDAIRYAILL